MGSESASFRHGRTEPRWLKRLPKRYQPDFLDSVHDTNQVRLTSCIAVLEGFIGDRLEKLDTGESGETWRALRDLYDCLLKSGEQLEGEVPGTPHHAELKREYQQIVDGIGVLIGEGNRDYAIVNEIVGLIEQFRKMADSEGKIIERRFLMTPNDQIAAFIEGFASDLDEIVTDADLREKIAQALRERSRALSPEAGEAA